jgi:phage baseplate assembly protein W
MNIDFPFRFAEGGRTAAADDEQHIRDMLEQLLFTSPGERVNRPDFGVGLLRMVFAPNTPEVAAALEYSIQAGVQRWLGDLVELTGLRVLSDEATLSVTAEYVVRRTGERRAEQFQRPV